MHNQKKTIMSSTPDQHNDTLKPIHIDQLFQSKNPRLAKWIPGFVYRWLSKLICLDSINDFISRYGDRKGIDFADAVIEYLNLSFQIEGEEHLPSADGRYIFVSNHPLGGPDGIILISFLGKKYPELKFPVNDLLLNLKNLNNIFLPVNKHGGQSRKAVKAIGEAYASNSQVIMFPAGLCSRKNHGTVKDLTWQKNFVCEAIRHQRDIVPIHISGQNSNLFYNLANFRKKIGIKANLEMMLLPKESFNKKGATFTLKIGKPIPWQSLDKTQKPVETAAAIKEQLYRL